MGMNPMTIMQLGALWTKFTQRHPKFAPFIKAASQAAMQEGAILEIQVTTPDGKNIASNLKVTKEDLEMLQIIRDMQQNQ